MSIDMRQFQQTFFAESSEGLEVMESGLLSLQPEALDPETINAIFRAAHSIKGGAGTFGFDSISTFTHVVETLLDELRAGTRQADAALIDLLLQSVDALRAMFEDAQAERPIDLGPHQVTQRALEQALHAESGPATSAESDAGHESPTAGWTIDFRPHPELYSTGNDPLHVLRELASMGQLEATVHTDALQDLTVIDPTQCYLRWDLVLRGDVDEAAVREAFAWIEDECDLTITALDAETGEPAQASAPVAQNQAPSTGTAPQVSKTARPGGGSSASIRVAVDKIDSLINLVGELVITQSMLHQASLDMDPMHHEKLIAGLELLARNTRDIQEAVMSTRMVAIETVFKRFPRVLHDVAARLGKQVELQTEGEGTELDRGVTEKIVDPLTHIIRNCVDHGIESPERRAAAGKSKTGRITLRAAHEGGYIVIDVIDDGAGLNRERILEKAKSSGLAASDDMPDSEVWQLLFAPGFSTAEAVTDLSGRGVGMDVVKRNIVGLGGQVTLSSEAGQGTR
ncbi:chemotaxis protein CheA, partial [uncultured Abyssibacter sp.]|uniref:chemotaxis protein CheA n=1 Tax=uncultured Abyssibacter sp. TaxID=2320202 RepID=UPI0032B248EF